MKKIKFSEAVARAQKIREIYHRLEVKHHGSEWTTEEDALAFLTDAGLVGRLAMARQGRWPMEAESVGELEHKLGECIWWLIVIAERLGIDVESALEGFLSRTERQLEGSLPAAQSRAKTKGRVGKKSKR